MKFPGRKHRFTAYWLCPMVALSLLLCLFASSSLASTVASGLTYLGATIDPVQRKSFYASGRHWVFYGDGKNMVYKTSRDAENWSGATTVRPCVQGYYFSVWFDGTCVHYAAYPGTSGSPLVYRRGIPESSGSITWSAPEQTVVPGKLGNQYKFPFVAVDSYGYPWIGT